MLTSKDYHEMGIKLTGTRNYDEAIECFEMAISLNPNFVESHCDMGVNYIRKGEYDKAIDCLKKAIALKPDFATAHYGMGDVNFALKEYDKAIEYYQNAIMFSPNDEIKALAYYQMGGAYSIGTRNYDKAMECYNMVIRLRPNTPGAYYNKGEILAYRENYGLAAQEMMKATELGYNKAAEWLRDNEDRWNFGQ
jgi:tetratricopeptide (TPR) repeat protein